MNRLTITIALGLLCALASIANPPSNCDEPEEVPQGPWQPHQDNDPELILEPLHWQDSQEMFTREAQ